MMTPVDHMSTSLLYLEPRVRFGFVGVVAKVSGLGFGYELDGCGKGLDRVGLSFMSHTRPSCSWVEEFREQRNRGSHTS